MSGAGNQGAGGSPGGLGEPEEAFEFRGKAFEDPLSGGGREGRRIDAHTGRYVFDENGRIAGMKRAEQIVLLACLTDEGSSAVVDMGNRLKRIAKLDQGTTRQLQNVYALALAKHSASIRLRSVTAERVGSSGAFVRVAYTDLTNGTDGVVDVRS